ncbi:hypothetical protein F5Y19DRAFT_410829 [Xylariaceae sp. FL1651]|nr:hypothetical protein F5Y19DRAFT_410829 [Xylariaceae sp. FL1651]
MTRKRARPNPSDESAIGFTPSLLPQSARVASQLTNASSPGMPPPKRDDSTSSTTKQSHEGQNVRKTKSWYGSWPRGSKSSASTQVARETIMGGTLRSGAAADFSRFEMKKTGSSTDSDTQSARTLPKITETDIQPQQDDLMSSQPQPEARRTDDDLGHKTIANEPTVSNNDIDQPHASTAESSNAPSSSASWLSWLGRPIKQEQGQSGGNNIPVEHMKDLDTETPVSSQDTQVQQPPPPPPETPGLAKPTSSWFGLWSSSATPLATQSVDREFLSDDTKPEQQKTKDSEDTVMQDVPVSLVPASTIAQPSAGSTWAFWSKSTTSQKSQKTGGSVSSEHGELAVMGEGSENSPRATSVEVNQDASVQKELPIKPTKEQLPKGGPNKRSKRERPRSMMDLDEPSAARPNIPQSDTSSKNLPSKSATPTSNKDLPRNLLLPSFKSTYRMKENPSIIKQITQLLLRTQQPFANHVFLSQETPKVNKAIAIGVHGLFPASYLRPMIGQPTGTSMRFANHCAAAIRRWTESHGCGGCEIETIALEGDGKIADRVDNLWKLLLNWIEHIRHADLVVLACHSQGVPVGIMLLAKLIDLGVITNSRIGVCAMAGVSLGPFPDYKSGMGMLMGSAAELWQFADPESEVSRRYEHSLKLVVDYGARITYVGSIDDQLVPMESALYSPASHPYIYRAVFIDGRIHAPDFIAHLIGFALKLRNLGISDHGLIRELSVPLAGSLYSGEGHSRLYADDQVYDLAISHTLETTSVSGVPCQIRKREGLNNPNPYVLPWIMRGLLEEEFVKTELYSETAELLKQFNDWTPATKALKDVKYRLEAVRSKL